VINEKQVNEWFDSPVTKQFFKDLEIRRDELEVSPYLSQSPEDTFRIGWWIQGGIEELDRIIDTTVADLVTEREVA
jgi:hypothetical protein